MVPVLLSYKMDALSNKWILDKAASDDIAPFLKEMGAPWLIVKAAASATPQLRLALTAASLEVKTYALLSTLKNEYFFSSESTHKAMDGSVSPARASLGPGCVRVSISHARGEIAQTFELLPSGEMLMTIVLSRGGAEVLRLRRVHKKVA